MKSYIITILSTIFLSLGVYSQGINIPMPTKPEQKTNAEDKTQHKIQQRGQFLFDLDGVLTVNGKAHNIVAGRPFTHLHEKGDQFHFKTDDNYINETLPTGKGEYVFTEGYRFDFRFKDEYDLEKQRKDKERQKEKEKQNDLRAKAEYDRYVGSILQPLNDDFVEIEEKVIFYDNRDVGMQSFQISTKEVTKRQYRLFKEMTKDEDSASNVYQDNEETISIVLNSSSQIASPKEKRANINWTNDEEGLRTDEESSLDHPVSFITYDEAKSFCNWLNRIDKTHYYRLPYSYEWDYVMSEGFQNTYPWPADIDEAEVSSYANLQDISIMGTFYNFGPSCHKWNDGYTFKSPVASYRPNGFGVFDLAGNVAEWTEDTARDRPGYKIIKGGSFFVTKDQAQLSKTTMTAASFDATMRHYGIGMRLVRVPK